MTITKKIGLALALVVAISVGASASASAATPELVNKEGKALIKNHYTGTSGQVTFETVGGTRVQCKSASGGGKMDTVNSGEATIIFQGCTSTGFSCKTPGAKAGEIVEPGSGKLVYISKSSKTVALLIEIETGREVVCSGIKILLRGDIIGQVGPVNTFKTAFSDSAKQAKGVAEVTEYENEKGEKVKAIWETSFEGKAFEQTAFEGSAELRFEEEAEIKA